MLQKFLRDFIYQKVRIVCINYTFEKNENFINLQKNMINTKLKKYITNF